LFEKKKIIYFYIENRTIDKRYQSMIQKEEEKEEEEDIFMSR